MHSFVAKRQPNKCSLKCSSKSVNMLWASNYFWWENTLKCASMCRFGSFISAVYNIRCTLKEKIKESQAVEVEGAVLVLVPSFQARFCHHDFPSVSRRVTSSGCLGDRREILQFFFSCWVAAGRLMGNVTLFIGPFLKFEGPSRTENHVKSRFYSIFCFLLLHLILHFGHVMVEKGICEGRIRSWGRQKLFQVKFSWMLHKSNFLKK